MSGSSGSALSAAPVASIVPGAGLHHRAKGSRPGERVLGPEFAIGIEGLERFVCGEPLRRVHECTFAVLALESEPVDPGL